MPYVIKNTDVRLANYGTLQEPHLYAITAGQYNKKNFAFSYQNRGGFSYTEN